MPSPTGSMHRRSRPAVVIHASYGCMLNGSCLAAHCPTRIKVERLEDCQIPFVLPGRFVRRLPYKAKIIHRAIGIAAVFRKDQREPIPPHIKTLEMLWENALHAASGAPSFRLCSLCDKGTLASQVVSCCLCGLTMHPDCCASLTSGASDYMPRAYGEWGICFALEVVPHIYRESMCELCTAWYLRMTPE